MVMALAWARHAWKKELMGSSGKVEGVRWEGRMMIRTLLANEDDNGSTLSDISGSPEDPSNSPRIVAV